MKKKNHFRISMIYFFTLFFLLLCVQSKNNFTAAENGKDLSIIRNWKIDPMIDRIAVEKKNLLYLLRKEPKKTLSLKVIAESELFEKKIFKNESRKIELLKSFPFKSYSILMEKIKHSVPSVNSECFVINRENRKPLDPSKKITVTITFKSTETLSPEEDVESYAVVYLDKKKIGTTEQKLLSQPKIIEINTTFERHLLRLEVYVQDTYRKAWVRLKNLDQPQPKYFMPQEGKDGLALNIIYFPKNEKDKYQYDGNFYK